MIMIYESERLEVKRVYVSPLFNDPTEVKYFRIH